MMHVMEQLIADIELYAARRGIKPATVLQTGAGLSGTTWDKWVAGSASCTMPTADRLRAWMASNPPQAKDAA
ncbi:MAG: XRE family transcriptional regulator [Pseudomonadota bacterium]